MKTLCLILCVFFVFPITHGWAGTATSDQERFPEGGVVYEPLCPQIRTTQEAPKPFLSLKNPLESSRENIFSGQTLFHFDVKPVPCRVCHGISGNGLGVLVRDLSPGSRNFTCDRIMKGIPDGQLFWIIRNGSKGTAMPAFKNLTDEQVWQLILYIRSFANQAGEGKE